MKFFVDVFLNNWQYIMCVMIGFGMSMFWPNLFAPWTWFNKSKRMKSLLRKNKSIKP